MQLAQDNPEFRYVLRGIAPGGVLVNQDTVARSFLLSPHRLVEGWRPTSPSALVPEIKPR